MNLPPIDPQTIIAAVSTGLAALFGTQMWFKNRAEMKEDRPDIALVFASRARDQEDLRHLSFDVVVVNNAPRSLRVEEIRLKRADGIRLLGHNVETDNVGTMIVRENRLLPAKGETLEGFWGGAIYSSERFSATISVPSDMTRFNVTFSIVTSSNAERVRRNSLRMQREITIQPNMHIVCR